MIHKALPKLESSALNGMSSIVQEAFEYKHLAMAILCLCPPDSTVYIYKDSDALAFYESKTILDCLNHFGRVPIILDWSNSF